MSTYRKGSRTRMDSLVSESSAISDDSSGQHARIIDFSGSVALLLNNIVGPGMVLFPALFQAAGWLPVAIVLAVVSLLCTLSGLMLTQAMALMPGNHDYSERVEYTTVAKLLLPRRWYLLVQIIFQLAYGSVLMSTIIESAQIMDWTFVGVTNSTYALEIAPRFGHVLHSHGVDPATAVTPFGGQYVLTLGFGAVAVFCLPFGALTLGQNIILQKIAVTLLAAILGVWIYLFDEQGFVAERVPVIGTRFDKVLGVVIFNYAMIMGIPSWVNEKRPGVSVSNSLFSAMGLAFVCYVVMGILGGMAFAPYFNTHDDLLTKMNDLQHATKLHKLLGKITEYAYPIVVNLTSIPVFSIMMRYNLLESGLVPRWVATVLSMILPWCICVPLYTGDGFQVLVTWAGLVFNSAANFIIPPLLYVAAVRASERTGTAAFDEALAERRRLMRGKPLAKTAVLLGSDDLGVDPGGIKVVPAALYSMRIPIAFAVVAIFSVLVCIVVGLNVDALVKQS